MKAIRWFIDYVMGSVVVGSIPLSLLWLLVLGKWKIALLEVGVVLLACLTHRLAMLPGMVVGLGAFGLMAAKPRMAALANGLAMLLSLLLSLGLGAFLVLLVQPVPHVAARWPFLLGMYRAANVQPILTGGDAERDSHLLGSMAAMLGMVSAAVVAVMVAMDAPERWVWWTVAGIAATGAAITAVVVLLFADAAMRDLQQQELP